MSGECQKLYILLQYLGINFGFITLCGRLWVDLENFSNLYLDILFIEVLVLRKIY
jgi:hypothetical protein